MDRPVKNPVPIRTESDKTKGYGYGFRLIRSEPDPLTGLILVNKNTKIWSMTRIRPVKLVLVN